MLFLVSCGVGEHSHDVEDVDGWSGTKNGEGWNASAPSAPFEVGPIQAALFATDPDNDGRYASALLYLSDSDRPCDVLLNVQSNYDISPLISVGNGFVFGLYRWVDQPASRPVPDFEGLYMGGYGYGPGGDQFGMYSAVFHDGTLYSTYYGGLAWVRIDTANSTEVTGEFYVNFWAGEFQAVNCGEWDEPTWGHTGWYY